ncbi:MAG TPA: hypothetical protein VFE05_11655 [Longimicrobiaceae bacterium]|jgi:hypothetical protein|nr:hypothetical protein [Longimicrobiaceae bacterium]
MKRISPLAATLLLAVMAGACGGDRSASLTSPQAAAYDARPGHSPLPRVVHRAPGAPRFGTDSASFDAVAGRPGVVVIGFADGTPLAAFVAGPDALRGATLGGRPVRNGEKVRITMRRVDGDRFAVAMEPSGLVFNPAAQPRITFSYRWADPPPYHETLRVWSQDAGEPWRALEGADDSWLRTVSAPVPGFTQFAVGY